MAELPTSVDQIAQCQVRPPKNTVCKASSHLLQLLTFLGVDYDASFESIVDLTQREWLRRKGAERWQMPERFEEKRTQLLERFREMGLVEPVFAREKHYDYAVIHGATLARVRSRVEWAVSEWNKGVRFDAIVILSGERVLDEELEMQEILKTWRCCEILPRNEIEMIGWLWKRIYLPERMRDLPVTLVDARASDFRAHTGDTVDEWLNKDPRSGSILAVSDQPFVSYQDLSMRNKMPSRFKIETIGAKATHDTMNVVYLDNLARLLFELRKWTEKN